jgi:non-lysosomal glucosylceramidase
MLQHDSLCIGCGGDQSLVGQFLYLEGHEYLMYNTYDVHFYASFALLLLWPELELSLQRDIAISVTKEDFQQRRMMGEGNICQRKVKVSCCHAFFEQVQSVIETTLQGVVPHDVGSPSEFPFLVPNAYNFQDVSRWKDLGPKFVLQVCRDFQYLSRKSLSTANELATNSYDQFLLFVYPTMLSVMNKMLSFDTDNDGMIENSGFPDQTYDIWTARGVHAYCGGLWIAACEAMALFAKHNSIQDSATADTFSMIAKKAQQVYLKELFNGNYLLYDNSDSLHSDSIMADMLAGQWFSMACYLPLVVPLPIAATCLNTIYQSNVVTFGGGQWLGAVNGMRPNGHVDESCLQSREVWTGTTYALAATMIHTFLKLRDVEVDDDISKLQDTNLVSMAMNTARGIHDAGWQRFGYWFATPEGWEKNGNYRSLGYKRPLSIWAMQFAVEQHFIDK